MHQILPILQYLIMGMGVAGVGLMIFGLMAKKASKTISVKLVTDEPLRELRIGGQATNSQTMANTPDTEPSKVVFETVNDVLGKL